MSERSRIKKIAKGITRNIEMFANREQEYVVTSTDFDFTEPARNCAKRVAERHEIEPATAALAAFMRRLFETGTIDAIKIQEIKEPRCSPMLDVTIITPVLDREKSSDTLEAVDQASGLLAEPTGDMFPVGIWFTEYHTDEDPRTMKRQNLIPLGDPEYENPLVFLRFQR